MMKSNTALIMVVLYVVFLAIVSHAQVETQQKDAELLPSKFQGLKLGMSEVDYIQAFPLSLIDLGRIGDEAEVCDTVYRLKMPDEFWSEPRIGFKNHVLVYVGLVSKQDKGTREDYSRILNETIVRLGKPSMASGSPATAEQSSIWNIMNYMVILTYYEEKGAETVVYLVTP